MRELGAFPEAHRSAGRPLDFYFQNCSIEMDADAPGPPAGGDPSPPAESAR